LTLNKTDVHSGDEWNRPRSARKETNMGEHAVKVPDAVPANGVAVLADPVEASATASTSELVTESDESMLSDAELESLLLREITIDGMCGVY
jgi:mycofactocin precursor